MRSPRRLLPALRALTLVVGLGCPTWPQEPADPKPAGRDYLVLEDFSDGPLGGIPHGWHWRGKDDDKPKLYTVQEQHGHRYVAAVDTGLSVVILRPTAWNPRRYPILTWCWRAEALPDGGDERFTETNDSAAGVYVVFSRSWLGVPRQIKYVWSTTLPVGTVDRREGFARPWFVVLESGSQRVGHWVLEIVDLERDHRRILHRDLPAETLAIGLLTDANSTHSRAAASYAGFRAWRREALESGRLEDYCPCQDTGAAPGWGATERRP